MQFRRGAYNAHNEKVIVWFLDYGFGISGIIRDGLCPKQYGYVH